MQPAVIKHPLLKNNALAPTAQTIFSASHRLSFASLDHHNGDHNSSRVLWGSTLNPWQHQMEEGPDHFLQASCVFKIDDP
jgi:hypothetical protein